MTQSLRWIMIVLVVFLVAKDTLQLDAQLVLRGAAQALTLGCGAWWLLKNPGNAFSKRHALLFTYLLVLILTVFVSRDALWSGFQVLSLISVVLFFVAVVESSVDSNDINGLVRKLVTLSYALACTGSIVAIWLWPEIVYGVEGATNKVRFTGLFTQPAMLATGSGVLLGFVTYGRFQWGPGGHLVRLSTSAVAILCLVLAGARTFWIAAVLAMAITYAFYGRRRVLGLLGAGYLAVSVALAVFAFDLQPSEKQIDDAVRLESISTLSGRSSLWELSTGQIAKRLLLGYGYTMGGVALYDAETSRSESADYLEHLRRQGVERPSLHNGYIQALLDSGIIGGSLYVVIIVGAILRVLINDRRREYAPELYVLVFLATANLGESVISSAAVFHAILFWYTVVLATTVNGAGRRERRMPSRSHLASGGGTTASPGRLTGQLAPCLRSP